MQTVAIIAQDPTLIQFKAEMETMITRFTRELSDLDGEVDKLQKRADIEKLGLWKRIIDHLKVKGALPEDFTQEKYHLGIVEGKVVYHLQSECADMDHGDRPPMPAVLLDALKGLAGAGLKVRMGQGNQKGRLYPVKNDIMN